jgi:hypothetical protein
VSATVALLIPIGEHTSVRRSRQWQEGPAQFDDAGVAAVSGSALSPDILCSVDSAATRTASLVVRFTSHSTVDVGEVVIRRHPMRRQELPQ